MSDGCRAFEQQAHNAEMDPAGQSAWAAHLRSCRSCREQDTADRALRHLFAGARRPDLPPFFAERSARHARVAPAACPLTPRRRLLLRAYWVLTLVVSAVVLARTDWPATVPPAVAAGAVLTAATVLTPVLLLAHLRGGLRALMRRVAGLSA